MEREREEREGGERERGRERKSEGRGRGEEQASSGTALFRHRRFKLDRVARRLWEEGVTGDSRHGSFLVGCLKTARRQSNLEERETGMRILPKWKGSCLR